ncbi:MAG: VWA domain-containing protein, partial [Chloroflexota bacterium]
FPQKMISCARSCASRLFASGEGSELAMISFLWPSMLYSFAVIPLLIALYLNQQERRKQIVENYGKLGLVLGESGRGLGRRRHVPATLFLISLTVLILALARPQTVLSLPRVQGTVLLVFDVSGSMAAEDFQPTRLEAAKEAARQFVQKQPPGVKIGVIAFSEGGLPVLAPTEDQVAILAAIDRLSTQRGTSLANGILMGLNSAAQIEIPVTGTADSPALDAEALAARDLSSVVIVLLTDGENNMDPDPFEVAQVASEAGIRIHTVGIGSPAGVDLQVEGFTVHTQLDEAALQQISAMTGGTYFNAQTEEDLRAIYENIKPQMVIDEEEMEITSLLAGIGILILLMGGAFSLLWFNRMP